MVIAAEVMHKYFGFKKLKDINANNLKRKPVKR
jgi:hypothetical protein